jgi:hypothetical protein
MKTQATALLALAVLARYAFAHAEDDGDDSRTYVEKHMARELFHSLLVSFDVLC